ncbi:MAG TPA: polysaccharide biosynthesis tyrosine autokinase, partial [Mucilaginibacter sp.]|nr:polysaccharide biosynthesis tyrosine autokinase [Mucilaginibacter sp.]
VFLIFIFITMIGAYAFQMVARPAYDIKATLLLQDDSQSNDMVQSMGISGTSKSLENDIEVLNSRRLITNVVNDLKLWVSYKVVVNHLKKDIYGNECPITFNLLKPGVGRNQNITIVIKNANSFTLKSSDQSNDESASYSFNSDVTTQAGLWQITPTPNLNKHIGSTIVIHLTDPQSVVTRIQGSLDVALKDKMESSAVVISYKDQIPQRGQDVVNHLISQYNKLQVDDKNARTKTKLDFIDRRLDSLSVDLNYTEKQVERFRISHEITDIQSQSNSYLQSAQVNDTKLADVNVQLRVINDIENYINSPNVSDKTVPSAIGINDPNLVSLVQSYVEQQRQRSSLLATTPEKNPAFDPINKQLSTTRTAIRENINNIKSSLQVTRSELQSYGSKYRSSIESIPGKDRQLAALKRLQVSKEALYNLLLQKREEAALDYASALPNVQTVDVAYVIAPKASKRLMPFAAALILGLLIPAGLIYLRDVIRNKVNNRRSIEKALPVPIAGELVESDLRTPIVADAVNDKVSFMLIEQFRGLRTQLHYLHNNDNKGRITLLVSGVAGEGKSFVSSNLAVALAASGKRTIILELNLYRPAMVQLFNLPESHPGMSNYLKGESTEEAVIQHSVTHRNLDVITSGRFIPDFSELLDGKRIEVLIDWLRLHYDHILIDTSPLQVVGDANIVARLCDITLYVIRKNFTSKSQLLYINNLCIEKQLPNLSIVFNGADSAKKTHKDYFNANG